MRKMNSFRLDEICSERLENMSRMLGISKTDVLEELINFGFDVVLDNANHVDSEHSAQRFLYRWNERLK